jgi:hypothetical protein
MMGLTSSPAGTTRSAAVVRVDPIKAALARGILLTKSGKRHSQGGRVRWLGRLDGSVVAWCPWCDYDGTEVREGADFGQRLDAAIGAHLVQCPEFIEDVLAALEREAA